MSATMPLSIAIVLLYLPFCLAKTLWSSQPANASDILRSAFPVGNGILGLLPYGEPGRETLNINRDSLWTGGPFENSSYQGGNAGPKYQYLPGIRDWIWQNGTGNVSRLKGDDSNYGSYAVLGDLSVSIDGILNVSDYRRQIDLDTGVHRTTYSANGASFGINIYCSSPAQICMYDIESTKVLPAVQVNFGNALFNASLVNVSCSASRVELRGRTEAGIGMIYQATARFIGDDAFMRCTNGSLTVTSSASKRATIVLAAGTDFDQSKGNAANKFSFRGLDPALYLRDVLARAASRTADALHKEHVTDFQALMSVFQIDLPDTRDSAALPTSELISRYSANSSFCDPYLESLTFDFARYLFISSSRTGSLPPNLQGRWATGLSNAWSGDYHLDINLEMNHWHVEQTGLGVLQTPLWQFLSENLAPRGRETAHLVYNASGWVTHDESNIFSFTGMRPGDDYWDDQPIVAAWLMLHVWDHFDYSQDFAWLKVTGYPMLKDISSFWLSQLQQDQYHRDGTLVVNPCSSAEHGPTTFGCTYYQQLIYQLTVTTLQSADALDDPDESFVTNLQTAIPQLDKGLHIGSWGQIQEWKLDLDVQNDTHRHLSNLIGWFPSFSLSSYLDGYRNKTIQDAVATTLYSRGPGIADANAGWEKVWRSACWARLNNTDQAYYELRLTMAENWAPNLLSMYSGKNEPFQIDANFGFAGAVLSMLVVDLPALDEGIRTVVLGPAIPRAWGNGRVKGLRLRGGGKVEFRWDEDGLVIEANVTRGSQEVMVVNKIGTVLH